MAMVLIAVMITKASSSESWHVLRCDKSMMMMMVLRRMLVMTRLMTVTVWRLC